MNFLVCDSSYVSNYLFDVIGWIMILSLLLLFVFISIKGCKIIGKFVKNKFLMIFLDIILCFSILILFLCFLLLVLLFSTEFIDNSNLVINYLGYRSYFGFHYLVMVVSLLLDFIFIYSFISKDKFFRKRFLLILILLISIFSGTYFVLDQVAVNFDYYKIVCKD